eukprot:PhM_4_TR6244/c0_g1_i1/m.86657
MSSIPKHYDKFTYPVHRRAGSEDRSTAASGASKKAKGGDISDRKSKPKQSSPQQQLRYYDRALELTILDGGSDGNQGQRFALDEAGRIMHRAVVPPRDLRRVDEGDCVITARQSVVVEKPQQQDSPSRRRTATTAPPQHIEDAWGRLVALSRDDFDEDELILLYWESLHVLLVDHYNMHDPLEIARIQIAWKQRQPQLTSKQQLQQQQQQAPLRMATSLATMSSSSTQGGGGGGKLTQKNVKTNGISSAKR